MKHLMIDIETMGTTPQAAILSIGAVFFDIETGLMGAEFEKHVSLESQHDRKIEGGTFFWWMSQDDAARKQIADPEVLRKHLGPTLNDLSRFVRTHSQPNELKVWSNGAGFDVTILEDAYRRESIEIPWRYGDVLDVRTIRFLAFKNTRLAESDFVMTGTKHNALDDAKHQVKYVSKMYASLTCRPRFNFYTYSC